MANPKDDPKNEQRLETLRQLWAHVLRLEAEEIADGDSFFECTVFRKSILPIKIHSFADHCCAVNT